MKAEDHYLKFVRWENEDKLYIGYCPDLFPWGGVCHGPNEEETYRELCALVREEVEELVKSGKGLPPGATRPMRDAVPALASKSGFAIPSPLTLLTFQPGSTHALGIGIRK